MKPSPDPRWKIALSALFVVLVAFAVVRIALNKPAKPAPRKPAAARPLKPKKPAAKPAPSPAPEPAPAVSGAPRMAIVLDDWGRNRALDREVIALGEPVTFAVIPALPYSAAVAQDAHAAGLGVILHMPMQPKNVSENLEPSTITTDMTDDEIRRMLNAGLASVPHVEGVNNHMGSAVTSDLRAMRVILPHLKGKSLFFLDSNVISTTVGPQVAKESGIRYVKRDVFIDNELNSEAIKTQLRKAIKVALAHGEAVVIGHDHGVTIRAIKDVLPEIKKAGIKLVLVRDLARVRK